MLTCGAVRTFSLRSVVNAVGAWYRQTVGGVSAAAGWRKCT